MKRLILPFLIAVSTVSVLRAQDRPVSAGPSAAPRDTLAVLGTEELPELCDLSEVPETAALSAQQAGAKQRFLPMKRRIDREINKIKFVYAGEVSLGLTVSYGTLSSENTDFLLLLDNLNLDGSVFTINPSVGYFFRDNMSAGVRFGYSDLKGSLNTANLNLGEQNGINLSLDNVHLRNNSLSVGLFFRSYAGLDSKGHFGFFSEVDLSMESGRSEFTYATGGELRTSHSDNMKLSLGFNPGLAVYIFPNVCSTVSFGLGGIEYTKIRQKDDEGNLIGQRTASKMRFRLNLLNIRIGVNIHLWNKKSGKA